MVVMVRSITLLLVLLGVSVAAAHDSWINRARLTDPLSGEWCCNHIDCAIVPAGGIAEVAGGYVVSETGEVIASTRIIWRSPDGTWVRCRYLGGDKAGKTRCLIGPPPAT
jgi:hypothetical protein